MYALHAYRKATPIPWSVTPTAPMASHPLRTARGTAIPPSPDRAPFIPMSSGVIFRKIVNNGWVSYRQHPGEKEEIRKFALRTALAILVLLVVLGPRVRDRYKAQLATQQLEEIQSLTTKGDEIENRRVQLARLSRVKSLASEGGLGPTEATRSIWDVPEFADPGSDHTVAVLTDLRSN